MLLSFQSGLHKACSIVGHFPKAEALVNHSSMFVWGFLSSHGKRSCHVVPTMQVADFRQCGYVSLIPLTLEED